MTEAGIQEYKGKKLADVIEGYSFGQKIYLLALQRGLSGIESSQVVKGYGIKIDVYLLEPGFAQACQYFREEKWGNQKEVDEVWEELRARHFVDRVISDGEEQLDKPLKERDKSTIKAATQCALTYIERAEKKGKGGGEGASYDELILKRRRVFEEKGEDA
jgi:hypothetical protein